MKDRSQTSKVMGVPKRSFGVIRGYLESFEAVKLPVRLLVAVVRQLVLADLEFLEYYFGVLVSLLEIVIYQP